jgi:hypothetical protein
MVLLTTCVLVSYEKFLQDFRDWTQGFCVLTKCSTTWPHHQPFLGLGIFKIGFANYLSHLACNCDSSDLYFLSS